MTYVPNLGHYSPDGIVWANIFYRNQHAVRIELFSTEELSIAARKIWEEQMEIAGGGDPSHIVPDDGMQQEISDNEYHSLVTTNIVMNLDKYTEFGLNMCETIEKFS